MKIKKYIYISWIKEDYFIFLSGTNGRRADALISKRPGRLAEFVGWFFPGWGGYTSRMRTLFSILNWDLSCAFIHSIVCVHSLSMDPHVFTEIPSTTFRAREGWALPRSAKFASKACRLESPWWRHHPREDNSLGHSDCCLIWSIIAEGSYRLSWGGYYLIFFHKSQSFSLISLYL